MCSLQPPEAVLDLTSSYKHEYGERQTWLTLTKTVDDGLQLSYSALLAYLTAMVHASLREGYCLPVSQKKAIVTPLGST